MLVNKKDILNYIPQRFPFVFIDNLLSATSEGFSSSYNIENDNILLTGGLLSESGVIEHVAQTCAAGFGYLASLNKDQADKLGFIGAVSKVKINQLPELGNNLSTNVKVISQFENVFLIEGIVNCELGEVLHCQMKIVQT